MGVGEGFRKGVAVGVTNGSGVAVGVGVGKGMLDAAMGPETRLGIAVAVAVGDGNVRRTGESSACWGPSWLDEHANEPAIKTSRMEISVYFLKALCLSAVGACWKCSIGSDEIEGLVLM